MKVLFINNYKDGTGWANAGIHYILALDAAGIDVVPRCIKLNSIKAEVPKRILELEKKSDVGCDICIQAVLPHMMSYHGNFKKNIGLFFCETSHFNNTSWTEYLNSMNEVWVATESQIQACRNSYIKVPVKKIPVPCDITKYEKEYKPLELEIPENSFIFYHIGELIRRKNLAALIKAFHLEFAPYEPVELLIKTHKSGLTESECEVECNNLINEIKRSMRLYPDIRHYKDEIIINKRLSEEDIMRIHSTCHCGVFPSYAEGWCIPAFDSMAMGKTPIYAADGIDEFACEMFEIDNGLYYKNPAIYVNSRQELVFEQVGVTFPDMFISNENWQSIDINDLRFKMRNVYNNSTFRNDIRIDGINRAYDYTYQKIGERMKECLTQEI